MVIFIAFRHHTIIDCTVRRESGQFGGITFFRGRNDTLQLTTYTWNRQSWGGRRNDGSHMTDFLKSTELQYLRAEHGFATSN